MMVGILFVCMGNICRSPTAEGVFRKLLQDDGAELEVVVDSAGTHAYHVGEPPDRRAQAAALLHGVDISRHRGRAVTETDFYEFDYILAMDQRNYEFLSSMRPANSRARLKLFLEYSESPDIREVPDPYYGGTSGFEHVFELVESASRGLLISLKHGK